MNNDFHEYESDYLKRISQNPNHIETEEEKQARLVKEKIIDGAKNTELDSWDYAILYLIKRGEMGIEIKFGTMRVSESFLKLYCHDLIFASYNELTFDEIERIDAFVESVQYKQYESRLKRIITQSVKNRLQLISEIIGVVNTKHNLCDIPKSPSFSEVMSEKNIKRHIIQLTDLGESVLKEKRKQAINQYENMNKLYHEDKGKFYDELDLSKLMIPMIFAMGLSSSIMTHMMISDYGFIDAGGMPEGYGELDLGFLEF